MTIYILEGNECCFKTTTAELLSKKTGFPVIKGSSFELSSCTNKELFERFLEFAEMDAVIFDRFVYSNKVYATLYDDFSILTNEQRKHIEHLMKDKAEVVYLNAPDEVIKKRLSVRGDEYVNEDKIESISLMYEKVIDDIEQLTIWDFDTSKIDAEGIVELLLHN